MRKNYGVESTKLILKSLKIDRAENERRIEKNKAEGGGGHVSEIDERFSAPCSSQRNQHKHCSAGRLITAH